MSAVFFILFPIFFASAHCIIRWKLIEKFKFERSSYQYRFEKFLPKRMTWIAIFLAWFVAILIIEILRLELEYSLYGLSLPFFLAVMVFILIIVKIIIESLPFGRAAFRDFSVEGLFPDLVFALVKSVGIFSILDIGAAPYMNIGNVVISLALLIFIYADEYLSYYSWDFKRVR